MLIYVFFKRGQEGRSKADNKPQQGMDKLGDQIILYH